MKIIEGSVTAPRGFLAGGVCAGIKNKDDKDKKDVALIFSPKRCSAAGVFTTNRVQAACVRLTRSHLRDGYAQAIVANSGNANACTGEQGQADAAAMAELAAGLLTVDPNDVVVASTGVIGVNLPMDRIEKGIKEAAAQISADGGGNAARAIMTTDLIVKEMAVEINIKGKPVRIGAICKGSGMIHPNMATMLSFITTDVNISRECLAQLAKSTADLSYNMISVDRDTSTNDMMVILANGEAGNPVIDDPESEEAALFKEALDFVNIAQAKKIARDGEGATCMIEVQVVNAPDYATARLMARSVTGSNLTKAAVFGKDANWGRIMCAAGYSGAEFDPERVDIYLGEEKMAENGMGLVFDEERARQELNKDTVAIKLDLKAGDFNATAWGCDLTFDYVKINADYRT